MDLPAVFLDCLPGDALRARWGALEGLPRALQQAIAGARAAWPGIELEAEGFVAHVAARWPAEAPPDPGLSALNLRDLYLARACMQARAGAAEVFERDYLAHIPDMVAGLRLTGAQVERVRDRVRDRLLRGGDAAPAGPWSGLASYAGRGALSHWLQRIAVNVALNVKALKEERGRADVDDALQRLGESPELDYIRGLDLPGFAAAYAAAVRDAIAALPDELRVMLKMYYADGRPLRAIGLLFHLSEAAASRRLKKARESLATDIRQRLKDRLCLDTAQVESLRRFLHSQVGISLSGQLR